MEFELPPVEFTEEETEFLRKVEEGASTIELYECKPMWGDKKMTYAEFSEMVETIRAMLKSASHR